MNGKGLIFETKEGDVEDFLGAYGASMSSKLGDRLLSIVHLEWEALILYDIIFYLDVFRFACCLVPYCRDYSFSLPAFVH